MDVQAEIVKTGRHGISQSIRLSTYKAPMQEAWQRNKLYCKMKKCITQGGKTLLNPAVNGKKTAIVTF